MVWKCPACGFSENDEANMVCICGNRYSPDIQYQTLTNASEDAEVDPVTRRNIAAIKGTYFFFAAAVTFAAAASHSLKFIMTCFVPTIIAGYYIYKYKPSKVKLSHDEAIKQNSLDILTIVASDSKFYGNITRGELGILAVFVLLLPCIVSYLISSDTERFLGAMFALSVGSSMLGVLAIIVKRSLSSTLR